MSLFNFIISIFNLSFVDLLMFLLTISSFVFLVMFIISMIKKESLSEHFDNNTMKYFSALFFPSILVLIVVSFKLNVFIGCIFCVGICFCIRNIAESFRYRELYNNWITNYFDKREIRIKRRLALKKAYSFLKPYRNLLGKQILVNDNIQVTYNPEYHQFPKYTCISKKMNKNKGYDCFEAYSPDSKTLTDDIFNAVCYTFSEKTDLKSLYKFFKNCDYVIFNANVDFPIENQSSEPDAMEILKQKQQKILQKINTNKKKNNVKKININSAKEEELSALPGINLILAKSIINYIKENGEFNSFEEFIKYTKLKKHFESQLKELTYISKTILEIDGVESNHNERIVDLD